MRGRGCRGRAPDRAAESLGEIEAAAQAADEPIAILVEDSVLDAPPPAGRRTPRGIERTGHRQREQDQEGQAQIERPPALLRALAEAVRPAFAASLALHRCGVLLDR